jgi:hypothetical protein
MIPLRIVEAEREDFDGSVVELWRDDEFIGMVFWDGEATVVQVYPDGDGDVFDLDVGDLQRVLETAQQIVDPHAFDEDFAELRAEAGGDDEWADEHPATVELVREFDPQASHRSEDGEGFFPGAVAEAFITRCEDLDLAVVEMEGFDYDGERLVPRPGLELMIRPQEVMGWSEFRRFANARALESVTTWNTRDSLVFAFVVQQPDGESFVA